MSSGCELVRSQVGEADRWNCNISDDETNGSQLRILECDTGNESFDFYSKWCDAHPDQAVTHLEESLGQFWSVESEVSYSLDGSSCILRIAGDPNVEVFRWPGALTAWPPISKYLIWFLFNDLKNSLKSSGSACAIGHPTKEFRVNQALQGRTRVPVTLYIALVEIAHYAEGGPVDARIVVVDFHDLFPIDSTILVPCWLSSNRRVLFDSGRPDGAEDEYADDQPDNLL